MVLLCRVLPRVRRRSGATTARNKLPLRFSVGKAAVDVLRTELVLLLLLLLLLRESRFKSDGVFLDVLVDGDDDGNEGRGLTLLRR